MSLLVLLLALACHDTVTEPPPPQPSLAGVWIGPVGLATLELTIDDVQGTLTGAGSIGLGDPRTAVTASGQFLSPDINLTVTGTGYPTAQFSARLTPDSATIVGVYTGGGLSFPFPVALSRQ